MYTVRWIANRPDTSAEFFYFAESMSEYNAVTAEARESLADFIANYTVTRSQNDLSVDVVMEFSEKDSWKKYVNYLAAQKRDIIMARNTYFEANGHTLRMVTRVDDVIESDRIIDTSIDSVSNFNGYGEPKPTDSE